MGQEAIELADQHELDLILMDLKMPIVNGIEATKTIHQDHPEIKILVLTTYDDDEWVLMLFVLGLMGIFLKIQKREKVIEAIHGTAEGKSFLDPNVAGRIMQKNIPTTKETCIFTYR